MGLVYVCVCVHYYSDLIEIGGKTRNTICVFEHTYMRKRTEHIINQDYTIFRTHTTATATARTEQCDTHTHAFGGNRGGGSPNGPFPRQPTQEVGLPIINHFATRAKWCPPETQDASRTKRPFLLVAVCFFSLSLVLLAATSYIIIIFARFLYATLWRLHLGGRLVRLSTD